MEKLLKDMFQTNEFDIEKMETLAYCLREYFELEDYVEDIVFENTTEDGIYLPNDKLMYIDVNSILMSSYNEHKNWCEFYRLNPIRFYLINIILVMLHEFNHADQYRMSEEKTDDALHSVIREGIELGRRSPDNLTKDERRLYARHYEKVLTERNAIIESYNDLLKLNELDLLGTDELQYILYRLNYYLCYGYRFGQIPVKTYYSLRDKTEEYDKLNFNDNDYDLYTRLSWGLPVDKSIAKNRNKVRLLIKED